LNTYFIFTYRVVKYYETSTFTCLLYIMRNPPILCIDVVVNASNGRKVQEIAINSAMGTQKSVL